MAKITDHPDPAAQMSWQLRGGTARRPKEFIGHRAKSYDIGRHHYFNKYNIIK